MRNRTLSIFLTRMSRSDLVDEISVIEEFADWTFAITYQNDYWNLVIRRGHYRPGYCLPHEEPDLVQLNIANNPRGAALFCGASVTMKQTHSLMERVVLETENFVKLALNTLDETISQMKMKLAIRGVVI